MLRPEESRFAIAQRIKWTREALGLIPAAFARRVGISPQALNNYEIKAQRPAIDEALKICAATGVTLDWIYRGDKRNLPGELQEKFSAFESVMAKRA